RRSAISTSRYFEVAADGDPCGSVRSHTGTCAGTHRLAKVPRICLNSATMLYKSLTAVGHEGSQPACLPCQYSHSGLVNDERRTSRHRRDCVRRGTSVLAGPRRRPDCGRSRASVGGRDVSRPRQSDPDPADPRGRARTAVVQRLHGPAAAGGHHARIMAGIPGPPARPGGGPPPPPPPPPLFLGSRRPPPAPPRGAAPGT